MIEDEVLMITTPEEAENRLNTKLYDVADLVTSAATNTMCLGKTTTR